MKQCSKCNRNYSDDNLKFCLSDGTPLVSVYDDLDEVVIIEPQMHMPQPAEPVRQAISPMFTYLTIGLLSLVVGGAAVLWIKSGSSSIINEIPIMVSNSVEVKPSRGSDQLNKQKTSLQEQLELLEKEKQKLADEGKKLESQKKSSVQLPTPRNLPAYVVTKDRSGLYLRKEKSLASQPVVFAPEGSEVTVLFYDEKQTVINGRMGRWCRARYDGLEGWAWELYLRVE